MPYRSIIKIAAICLVLFSLSACKKEKFLTTGNVQFSIDTLTFDTVFTKYATFTREFKIFNPQGQKIMISSVRMEKGTNSPFHINVNGVKGNNVQNLELAGNDSLYVFATVTIDPTDENTPFVVEDKMIVTVNGQEQVVPFMAYGQNAYYIINQRLNTETWKTDKPYVIVRSAQVDSFQTLTIPAGCKVYMHGDSRLFVYGTLKIQGTKTDSVIFQGDRLDRGYFANKDFAGEWGGLYFFSSSKGNEITHAVIKNCGNTAFGAVPAAVQLEPGAEVAMRNTIIYNSLGHGVLSFGGLFSMNNCLVHSCGAHALAVFQGSGFDINNCTFALYSIGGINGLKHTDNPAVVLQNYFKLDDVTTYIGDLKGRIRNSIIWGGIETELFCSKVEDNRVVYELELTNTLYKSKDPLPDFVKPVANNIVNTDPEFENYTNWDFHLKATSPAIDKGVFLSGINDRDLEEKSRVNQVDLGCYERQ